MRTKRKVASSATCGSPPRTRAKAYLLTQREEIAKFAAKRGLGITAWFEEKETAAKRGRPVFGQVLQRLRKGEADGLIVHKVDRSARNLKDLADLGELIDSGIPVYFAGEGIDMNTRSGRLAADIQAVVAADFIRNLRERSEARDAEAPAEQARRPAHGFRSLAPPPQPLLHGLSPVRRDRSSKNPRGRLRVWTGVTGSIPPRLTFLVRLRRGREICRPATPHMNRWPGMLRKRR